MRWYAVAERALAGLVVWALLAGTAVAGTTVRVESMTVNGLEVRSLACELKGSALLGVMQVVASLAEQKRALDACVPAGGAFLVRWTWAGRKAKDVTVEKASHPDRADCVSAALGKTKSDLGGTCTAVVLVGKSAAARAAADALGGDASGAVAPAPAPPAPLTRDNLLELERMGELSLGMAAKAVQAALGKPETKGKQEFMAATGEWVRTWAYPKQGLSLELAAKRRGGPETLGSVSLAAPGTAKTRAGVGIGSSREEVTAAYGAVADPEFPPTDDRFVAGSLFGGLVFGFDAAGKVTSIFLGAAAE